MADHVNLTLPPNSSCLPDLRRSVAGSFQGVDRAVMADVLLALDEAVSNAIRHGSRGGEPGQVPGREQQTADELDAGVDPHQRRGVGGDSGRDLLQGGGQRVGHPRRPFDEGLGVVEGTRAVDHKGGAEQGASNGSYGSHGFSHTRCPMDYPGNVPTGLSSGRRHP